jgi:hypothetical protein
MAKGSVLSSKAQIVRDLLTANPEWDPNKMIEKTGISKTTVYRMYRERDKAVRESNGIGVPKGPGIDKDFSEKKGYVEFRTNKHIKDIDTALKEQGVDLEKWMVERVQTTENAWDVTMKVGKENKAFTRTNYQFKIKVFLKIRPDRHLRKGIDEYIKKIPTFKFTRVPRFSAGSGNALEIALLDAHMGKMAWAKETGRRDYDLPQSADDYKLACKKNLSWGSVFEPEKIFFIVGQDLMHIENFEGVTQKGHNVLDTDSRLPKVFETALSITTECIYMCRDIAPVEVIWIPGNHDQHASLFLTVALREHFRKDDHVTVDTTPMQRKARLWGNLLVGWTHDIVGRQIAWANELAQAFPKLWGKSVFREWHHGHKHKKQEIKTSPTTTHGGVLLRQLTALSPIDAWHFEHLFTDAVPGGEAFVWNDRTGVICNFTAWTDRPVRT